MQGLRSLVGQDKGPGIQAEGLSPAQKLHSAVVDILSPCQAEVEAAAGAQEGLEGPVGPVVQEVLEAGGCSVP